MTSGSSTRFKYVVLVAAIIGYMGSFGYAFAIISPILVPISNQFGVSVTRASLISTAMFIGAAVFAFPAGAITDRWGLKKAAILGQILLLFGWILMFISRDFTMVLVGRFVIGLGGTIVGIVGATSVVHWFVPNERMIPMGLWSACLPMGVAWGEVLAGEIVSVAGWRAAVFAGIIITLVCLSVVTLFVKSGPVRDEIRPSESPQSHQESSFVNTVLKNKDAWKFDFALFFGFIPFMSVTTYWVAWLMNSKAISSEVLSSTLASLIGIAGIFGSLAAGFLAYKLRKSKPVFVYPALITAVSLILFVFVKGISVLIVLSILIGFGSYMMATMINAIPPQLVSSKYIGSEFGIAVIFFYSAGIIGPFLVGTVYTMSGGLIAPGILMLFSLLVSVSFVMIMKIR